MNGVQECAHAPESSRCDVTPGPRLSCSWPQSGHVNIDMWSSCLTSSHRHVVRPDSGMSGCFDPVTRPKNRLAVLHSQSMRIGLIVAVGASALFLAGCGTEPKRGPAFEDCSSRLRYAGEVYGPNSDLKESAPPGKPLGRGDGGRLRRERPRSSSAHPCNTRHRSRRRDHRHRSRCLLAGSTSRSTSERSEWPTALRRR